MLLVKDRMDNCAFSHTSLNCTNVPKVPLALNQTRSSPYEKLRDVFTGWIEQILTNASNYYLKAELLPHGLHHDSACDCCVARAHKFNVLAV